MTPTKMGLGLAVSFFLAVSLAVPADQIALPGTPYSITLPGTPECDTEPEALDLPVAMSFPASCSAVVDGVKYTFDYMLLPYEVPRDQIKGAMFATALGHAAAMGGDIAEKKYGKVAGFRSMNFVIAAEDRGPLGYGRYVMVRNHLVRAVVEATEGNIVRESAEEVLNSLVIE